MFARFTEEARDVVRVALEQSQSLGRDYVGGEHLLLGLLSAERSIARRTLDSLGVTEARVREEIAPDRDVDRPEIRSEKPFKQDVTDALRHAPHEALALRDEFVGPEHILLGVLAVGSGEGWRILQSIGADAEAIRTAVGGLLESRAPKQRSPSVVTSHPPPRIVSGPTPEEAIAEHLRRQAAHTGIDTKSGHRQRDIDLSTVCFMKYRQAGRRRVYYVTYEYRDPQRPECHWKCVVEQDEEGNWWAHGGPSGGGVIIERPRPWVNLGGAGWPNRFYAGGCVDSAGLDIARVELQFPTGQTLEDDTEHGVVLFITNETVELPANVTLYDRSNREVAAHEWPTLPPRP